MDRAGVAYMGPMQKRDERAVTVLELIVFVSVLLIAVYLVFVFFTGQHAAGSTGGSGGVLPAVVGGTGKTLRVVGSALAFSAIDDNPSDVHAAYPVPNPARMGSLKANVALLIGDSGGVDFDRVSLVWISNGTAETIPRKDTAPLVCPGWTIAGKYGLIPLESANSNNILESGEQFEIFICPQTPLPAYRAFNIRIENSGGIQSPFLGGTAPVMNSPVSPLS